MKLHARGGLVWRQAYDVGLRLWDLRQIRRELAATQLDWSGPPIPPPAPESVRDWAVSFDPSTLPPDEGEPQDGR